MSTTPAAPAALRRLNHRDLDETPDDGNLWEVIDGELHATPQPTPAHQNVITQLATILNTHVRAHSLGMVFSAAIKVVLDEPMGVGPDLCFISTARLDGLRDDGFYGPPDLMVEVISTKPALDRIVKRDKYARAGIPHYWIIDPVKRSFEVYRLEADRYTLPLELTDDAVYEPEWLAGLRVPLRELWM
jgi:Uma2 family endonuclease